MNVSAERVASLHLAHLQKEASVTRGLEDLAKKAVIEDFRQKVIAVGKKKATKASNKGWAWVLKSEGADLVQVIQDAKKSKSSFDSKDPLTRLLHMTLSKVSDPFEKNRIVGEFSEKYAKKDIEGMANVLGVDRDVVTITLLWYGEMSKWLVKKLGHAGDPEARLEIRETRTKEGTDLTQDLNRETLLLQEEIPLLQEERLLLQEETLLLQEETLHQALKESQVRSLYRLRREDRLQALISLIQKSSMTSKSMKRWGRQILEQNLKITLGSLRETLKLASYITGGPVVEWLINLLPRGEILAKPAKWAWWAYLAKNSWTVISTAANWTSVAYNWLISISASSVPAVSGFLKGLKLFLIGGTGWTWFVLALFVLGSLIFVGKTIVQKAETFGEVMINTTKWQKTKLGFYWVWNAIKSAVSGVLNIGKYVRDEILDYVRENASMFNYMIRKYDVEEDPAPPEITEALVEAS